MHFFSYHKSYIHSAVCMQISEAKELSDLLGCDGYSFVRDVGYSKPEPKYGNKEDIVHSIALHYVILSVKAELDQIVQGLNEGGLHFKRRQLEIGLEFVRCSFAECNNFSEGSCEPKKDLQVIRVRGAAAPRVF